MTNEEDKQPLFRIDRSTLVPIGLLVSVVLASVGATTWIQSTLLGLEHKIDSLNLRVQAMVTNSQELWQLHDMQSWADLLAARNPNLNIPTPKRN